MLITINHFLDFNLNSTLPHFFTHRAHRVCREHGYSVQFTGVGASFDCWTDVGFCTQIGVFQRNYDGTNWSMTTTEHLEPSVYRLVRTQGVAIAFPYFSKGFKCNIIDSFLPKGHVLQTYIFFIIIKLYRVVYPSLYDNNIYQKTLVNEVLYEAKRLRQEWLQKNIDSNNNTHVHCYPSVEAEHRGAEGGADEQLPVYQQGGTICVPLSSVWSRPRVRGLCGTLHRLREILLDDSLTRLNADGTVLILPSVDDEEEEGEEEDKEDKDEEVKTASDLAENVKEDWDEELASFGNV